MAIAMQSNLVSLVCNHSALFGERLEGVAGNEEGCGYVVLLKQFEEPPNADRPGEESAGDVRRRVLAAI